MKKNLNSLIQERSLPLKRARESDNNGKLFGVVLSNIIESREARLSQVILHRQYLHVLFLLTDSEIIGHFILDNVSVNSRRQAQRRDPGMRSKIFSSGWQIFYEEKFSDLGLPAFGRSDFLEFETLGF